MVNVKEIGINVNFPGDIKVLYVNIRYYHTLCQNAKF